MAIQHKSIPDSELHEPKGVVSAPLNSTYLATGTGTGSWSKIGASSLKNLSGDAGASGKVLLTNGSDGFTLSTLSAFGVMSITNNGNAITLAAAADLSLVSTADYVLVTGTGAPWAGESLFGVTFDTNKLTAPIAGVYDFRMWASISQYPTSTGSLGFRFRINGTTWSPRTIISKSNAAGDYGNVSGFGLVSLNAGDYVQLYVASSSAGNLIIQNSNCTMDLKRAT